MFFFKELNYIYLLNGILKYRSTILWLSTYGRCLLWNPWQYLILIQMKCRNDVIPHSDVMTKITEMLLTK